jgi:para-aminobenzoate synthetase component I
MKRFKNDPDRRRLLIEEMNFLGEIQEPFIFIIDFDVNEYLVKPYGEIHPDEMLFEINGIKNCNTKNQEPILDVAFQKYPVPFDQYYHAFEAAQKSLAYGDSFLINLTFPTRIECNLSLREIFIASKAKYKLYVPDRFVVFSPETFVQIHNGVISSYPMKGTIDASEAFAREKILNDPKEHAEHATIVDLIRNDLSMVAHHVFVEKFRYIDELETHDKNLLQVSSKISGQLDQNYHSRIGDIVCSMLPAGSVTGAPKPKTVEIIKDIEGYRRGFYKGVFGYFDGHNLDSGVMIRFIEKQGNELYFKSGGGITIYSDAKKEYQELIDKIYVPIARVAENPGWTGVQC